MPPSADLPDREIKARKSFLYEPTSEPSAASGPRKSFAEVLRETPAEPLSTGVKAALIVTAVVVGLAFLASLYKGLGSKPKPRPAPAIQGTWDGASLYHDRFV